MKPRVLGVGVIGLGFAAQFHLRALAGLNTARIGALCDLDGSRIEAAARRWGESASFGDYRALLECPGVDVVAVLTPPADHKRMALDALAAGKHVLLEKPIASELEEARLLLRKANEARSKVTVAYTLRFHDQVRRLRQALRNGALGEVEVMRCFASMPILLDGDAPPYKSDRSLGGGAAIELGVHHYDLWSYLLDSPVTQVSATARGDTAHERTAVVTATTARGTIVTSCLTLCGAEQYVIEAVGSKACARASLYRYDGWELIPRGRFAGDPGMRAAALWESCRALLPALLRYRSGGMFHEAFRTQWREFLDAILNDHEPEPTLADGLSSLEVAFAAAEAIDTGVAVRVKYDGAVSAPRY